MKHWTVIAVLALAAMAAALPDGDWTVQVTVSGMS
jgi:hypothetical protein